MSFKVLNVEPVKKSIGKYVSAEDANVYTSQSIAHLERGSDKIKVTITTTEKVKGGTLYSGRLVYRWSAIQIVGDATEKEVYEFLEDSVIINVGKMTRDDEQCPERTPRRLSYSEQNKDGYVLLDVQAVGATVPTSSEVFRHLSRTRGRGLRWVHLPVP